MIFEENYIQSPNFPYRYIRPNKLFQFIRENLSNYEEIGSSHLEKPIYKASFGTGKIKIIAWSQMHGNESNATLAMLDLLETWKKHPVLLDEIFQKVQLDFIFMLNPDGSERWTRRNAIDIDVNRDFFKESSKEIRVLKETVSCLHYDYAFNLHEQRTIYSTDGIHPATMSFLSPSENEEREITETRKKSMAVISYISKQMERIIPHHIARYTDEFYPTSTGDNFTKMGIPTILFEGGHFEQDYLRHQTRKYYTIALYYGLKAISELINSTKDWEDYFNLPENKEDHFDIIYRNVKLNTDYDCVLDIAVQYQEQILEGNQEISFVPIVVEVGDCSRKKGWEEIDCTDKYFKSESLFPKLDSPQNFDIV